MASLRIGLWLLALLAGVTGLLSLSSPVQAGVDLPKLVHGKGDKCVADEDVIRRQHPDFLKHHRNETLREGIRTTRYSLKQCVECHASEKTGSVAAAPDDFCVACHRYAAVHLDCWDCHATKPMKKPVQAEAKPMPVTTAVEAGVKP